MPKRPLGTDAAGGMSSPTRPTGSLGDIMPNISTPSASEVVMTDFTPLQRVLLTANGNLQRLVSSYHNAPVSVSILKNERVADGRFSREVSISVFGVVFATARSTISVDCADYITAIVEKGLGIGQLFRHLCILPTFELAAAGRIACSAASDDGLERLLADASGGCFWRDYVLHGPDLKCEIREVIRSDVFAMQRPEGYEDPIESPSQSMGDIMAPNVTFQPLPEGFEPVQRMLLTANGNVERILSSYYAKPLQLYVVLNHKRAASVYDRQSIMLYEGRQLMLAKTTAFISKPEWSEALDEPGIHLGALFSRFGELPVFTLHATGEGPDYFWRQYALTASGMTCLVNETFSKASLAPLSSTATHASPRVT